MPKSFYHLVFNKDKYNSENSKEDKNMFFVTEEYRFSKLLFFISLLKNLFILGVIFLPIIYAMIKLFPSVTIHFLDFSLDMKTTIVTLVTLVFLYSFIRNVYEEAYY